MRVKHFDVKILNTRGCENPFAIFSLMFLFAISSACTQSGDPAITELVQARDFLNTSIIVPGNGVANDVTVFNLTIQLRNNNNTVIQNFVPEYTIISGSSFSAELGCTPSNQRGLSYCGFRTSAPGIRRIQLTNIPNVTPLIEKDFEFIPKQVQTFAVSSGGLTNALTNLGHNKSATIGEPIFVGRPVVDLSFEFITGLKGGLSNDNL